MTYKEYQLREMSDHEINIAVAEKLGFAVSLTFGCFGRNKIDGVPAKRLIQYRKNSVLFPIELTKLKDYCNNWNDVMPIALKYIREINIKRDENNSILYIVNSGFSDRSCGIDALDIVGADPKRAICEVFLMMETGI